MIIIHNPHVRMENHHGAIGTSFVSLSVLPGASAKAEDETCVPQGLGALDISWTTSHSMSIYVSHI